jgi:hypothetical protein
MRFGANRARDSPILAHSLFPPSRPHAFALSPPMHYDAHQPIIADLEARILTIRDSL